MADREKKRDPYLGGATRNGGVCSHVGVDPSFSPLYKWIWAFRFSIYIYVCVCTVYMYSIVDDAMLLLKWEAVKMKITRINMDTGEADPYLGGATRIHVILDFIWV